MVHLTAASSLNSAPGSQEGITTARVQPKEQGVSWAMERPRAWDRIPWLLATSLDLPKGTCLCLKLSRQHLSK